MSDSVAPFGQARFQVRFDWGAAGAERISPGAHVAVLVDALMFTTAAVVAAQGDAGDGGLAGVDATTADGAPAASVAEALAGTGAVVLAASLRNRAAVAERILALQEQRGERMIVAVVAVGEPGAGGVRFAVEDQLTAGAVIDALVGLGLDHTSPEAAVACAAFEGLRNAVVHLIGASASGVELSAAGRRADVRLATECDVTTVVPEWREGALRV